MYRPALFRNATIFLLLVIGIFIAATFHQHGISNDEEVQHIYGRLLLNFYSSGFTDQSAFHYKNLYLYGGFFDLIAASLEKLLPFWVWDMRHLLSALFGWAGILAAYKIARTLGGERAGFISALLLAVTAAWTGAMFTHTKDIPFAACMLWALYYTTLAAKQLPKIPLSLSLKLGSAIGCSLGLRIGGVFAVLYLGMLVSLAACLYLGSLQAKLRFCMSVIKQLIPAGLVAFVLMALFWPWAVMSPSHPFDAARAFSHFAFDMLTIIDGNVLNIGDVPRTYLMAYLSVRLPEAVLLGLVSALIIGLWQFCTNIHSVKSLAIKHANQWLPWASLLIAAMFPLAFVLWDTPALYNGVRHFTFVIPPLVILAGLGIHYGLASLTARPVLKLTAWGLCLLLVMNTVITLVQLHPYQYIYYNHFAGNIAKAENNWEADYWSSSLRKAADILKSNVDTGGGKGPYMVAVCAESLQGQAYLDKRFIVTKQWTSADFYLSTTNMHCDQVLKGKIIGKVERLGATLAVVKDRRNLHGNDRLPSPAPR